uniref:Uncharacterized protein n=1 Tax=Tanacetum cinerariifolium TaxID=118510 RepID=A0A6L2M427_TANCI|nr:hypothetical protein [Tanacetum cinerariifolium]
MVYVVNGVLASCVDMVLEKDFAGFALQEMEIHPLMFIIQTLSMILQTFLPTLHNASMSQTRVSYVETILTMVMIVHHGSRLSLSRNRATIKTLVIIIIHIIHRVFYNNIFVVITYSIDHQENLSQQRISDVHDRWDKLNESQNELLNMMQSFCEMVIQKKQAANIDQSPPQEMSIQDMEDLKQQYLDEMKSMNNQIQIEDYHYERIDIHYRRECEIKIDELKENFNGTSIEINKKKELQQLEQAANLSTYSTEPSRRSNSFCYVDDDDYDYKESTIPLNEIISQIPPTIPEKESDEFIKSSVENFVPIPKGQSVIFSNPLFDSNGDFTFSDDESLSDEDVLENIENKDSYDSNLDEPDLLVTPFFDANDDECFDPGGDIDEIGAFDIPSDFEDGYYGSKGDVLYLESFLSDDTTPNLPSEEFLDRDP